MFIISDPAYRNLWRKNPPNINVIQGFRMKLHDRVKSQTLIVKKTFCFVVWSNFFILTYLLLSFKIIFSKFFLYIIYIAPLVFFYYLEALMQNTRTELKEKKVNIVWTGHFNLKSGEQPTITTIPTWPSSPEVKWSLRAWM